MVSSAQSLSVCLLKVTQVLLETHHGGQGPCSYPSMLETGTDPKKKPDFFQGKESTEGETMSQEPAMRISNSLLEVIVVCYTLICLFAIILILLYFLRRPGTLVPLCWLGLLLYVPHVTVRAALDHAGGRAPNKEINLFIYFKKHLGATESKKEWSS